MKWMLIIGGNSDIGFELSKRFAEKNFNIYLASKNISQLKFKKKYLEKNFNIKCLISKIDLCEKKDLYKFSNKLKILPNTIILASGFLSENFKDLDKIIKINYSNLVNLIEILLKKKRIKKDLRTIIGISSIAGDRGKLKNNVYSSAKSGLINYLQGLQQRLYVDDINVMIVKPGYVKSKMTKNVKKNFLFTSSANAAKIIFNSYLSKKKVIYVPSFWKIIMFIYKLVPEFVFKFRIKNLI